MLVDHVDEPISDMSQIQGLLLIVSYKIIDSLNNFVAGKQTSNFDKISEDR